jgi:hypothetical protein
LEVQFAPAFRIQQFDPEFFLSFPDNSDLRRLSLFESPTDPVDFSRT